MKKLLLFVNTILLAGFIYAQDLNTVFVNPQFKGEEWWWGIRGINQSNLDSAQYRYYNRLVKALKDANLNSPTLYTYDSLPGVFAMIFFEDYWSRPEARENMGQGIDTKLRAFPELSPYIANSDAQRLAKFNARKTGGKNRTN